MADVQLQDYHDNAYADSRSVDFDGTLSMSAKVQSKNGQSMDIGYSIDVTATAEIGWETDEEPTGWNHGTDQPTYTSYTTATFGDITVTSVTFTPNGSYVVDNDEVEFYVLQQHVDPHVLKQLLNPTFYTADINKLFIKAVENLEPPEQDFDEPERDWD